MTAILVFAGIVVVVIATIVLVAVPVRHVEAMVSGFSWRRSVRIGTRVWVKRKSKRKPSGEVRNVEVQNAGGPGRRRYTYQERVWRKMRTVTKSGRSQASVQWPLYILGKDEEVQKEIESYTATFASEEEGRYYTANRSFEQWNSLQAGARYRLGRNTFGSVRTVKPVMAAVNQGRPGQAE